MPAGLLLTFDPFGVCLKIFESPGLESRRSWPGFSAFSLEGEKESLRSSGLSGVCHVIRESVERRPRRDEDAGLPTGAEGIRVHVHEPRERPPTEGGLDADGDVRRV